jgi:hypothetical protein
MCADSLRKFCASSITVAVIRLMRLTLASTSELSEVCPASLLLPVSIRTYNPKVAAVGLVVFFLAAIITRLRTHDHLFGLAVGFLLLAGAALLLGLYARGPGIRCSAILTAKGIRQYCLEGLVSAAGLEPATHALKGHCSTN